MDEPILYMRDGAHVLELPLSEVLWIYQEAETLARGVVKGDKDALEAANAIKAQAGPGRARASLGAYLLDVAVAGLERAKTAAAIPTTATVVAGESSGDAPAAVVAGPCAHPPDVACPSCATGFQERRNAQKRNGARA